MAFISTGEYQRKGHQIDLDVTNLDSAIQGISKNAPDTVPAVEITTWKALKSEWDHFFQENIKNTPILPIQDSGDLDTWLTRLESWRAKQAKWALSSGNVTAAQISKSLPTSPATIEHRENPPSKGAPTWVYLGLAALLLGGVGYSLSAVARLGGK